MAKTLQEAISSKSNDYSFLSGNYAAHTKEDLITDPFNPPVYDQNKEIPTVSVVIPAYNVGNSILACLASIEQSNFNLNHQNKLQVVVVNDGSKDNTWDLLKNSEFSLNLTALKQDNHGQAQALNTGISVAGGQIIISCDADMVLSHFAIDHFVARHQQIPNVLLAGFRLDVPTNDQRVNYKFIRDNGSHLCTHFTKDERIIYPVPGWPRNMCLASDNYKRLGNSRGLWMPDDRTYNDPWLLSDLVIGALFSVSKEVFVNVGGYDERLHGWGSTDGLLAAKAISNNQFILPIYAASGLHMHHDFRTTDKQVEYNRNRKVFYEIIQSDKTDNYPDFITPAKKRIKESFTKSPVSKNFGPVRQKETKDESWNFTDSMISIGEYAKAYEDILKNSSANSAEGQLRLGKIYIGMRKYQQAVKVFKDLDVSESLGPEILLNLSIAQAANSEFILANKSIKTLAKHYPTCPDLEYWFKTSSTEHIKQGDKYFNQTFYDTALRCFETALIINPSDLNALQKRKECLQKLK